MTSGIFVANAGHANPFIIKAIKKQLRNKVLYSYQYPTEIRENFVKKLLSISPKHLNKAILLNSGSESTDIAYRLLKSWGAAHNKKYIITFNGSYHGRCLGSSIINSSKDCVSWSKLDDKDVIFLDFPVTEGSVIDPSVLPPPSEILAFFLESYQGWSACRYPSSYINSINNFCKKNKILLAIDEVQAGFYRTGFLYGYMGYSKDIKPDLICLGKGISSSLPLSAVLARKEIIDCDPSANLSSTHSGNALCCAAALGNLEFLTRAKFQKSLLKKIEVFEEYNQKLKNNKNIIEVNYKGMVSGIILKNTEDANAIVNKILNKGVLAVWTQKNSIKLGPPLTISIKCIKKAMTLIESCINEYYE